MFMKEEDQTKLLDGFGLISRYIMSFLRLVMKFTPVGVFCLMANTTGKYGTDVLGPLGKFILTIYVGLAIHAFVVYGGLYAIGTRKNPFTFWKTIAPVWTTSFSTCSTAATMPVLSLIHIWRSCWRTWTSSWGRVPPIPWRSGSSGPGTAAPSPPF